MMLKISSVVLLAMAPVAGHAVELITNGGFNAGLTGFQVGGTAHINAVPGSLYVTNAGGTGSDAAQSNNFAQFGADNVGGTDTLSQSIATVAGKAYSLNFDFGTFGQPGLTMELYVGGALVNTFTPDGLLDLDTLFSTYTYSFVGTGTPLDITFSITSADTDNQDGLLDNISVSAVPDVATWALMIAGFSMVGVASRRRRTVVFG